MFERVECVILDLLMPGIDGSRARERSARPRRTRLLPIMILTGRDDARDRHTGAQIRRGRVRHQVA